MKSDDDDIAANAERASFSGRPAIFQRIQSRAKYFISPVVVIPAFVLKRSSNA